MSVSRRQFLKSSLFALATTGTIATTTSVPSKVIAQGNGTPNRSIREMMVGVDSKVSLANGTNAVAINFDNAAATPPFSQVLEEIQKQAQYYGSIGGGKGQKSQHSTKIYEQGRQTVLNFVGGNPDKHAVFYVNNTTDGLNKLASALITSKEDIVLTSRMEHHANDLPWRHRCNVIYAEVDRDGRLIYEDIERLLKENSGKVKYVSITAACNAAGYVNDVHAIASVAHKYGAQIIVDGAQIVAHRAFSMVGADESEDIDYFVFSAHKMYAPFGSGAVVGLKKELDTKMPNFFGGGMVNVVTDSFETYYDHPERYESGSPNYFGVVAMLKAIEILNDVGFEYIVEHEQVLMRRAIDGLKAIPGIILYSDVENIADKVGLVIFNIDGIPHGDTAQKLADKRAIAVRQGAFCSHPYVFRLLGISNEQIVRDMVRDDFVMPGMVRASFGIYNDEEEVDIFLETVKEIAAERR